MKSGSLKERIADALNELKSVYWTLPKQHEIGEINILLDDLSRAEVIEQDERQARDRMSAQQSENPSQNSRNAAKG